MWYILNRGLLIFTKKNINKLKKYKRRNKMFHKKNLKSILSLLVFFAAVASFTMLQGFDIQKGEPGHVNIKLIGINDPGCSLAVTLPDNSHMVLDKPFAVLLVTSIWRRIKNVSFFKHITMAFFNYYLDRTTF